MATLAMTRKYSIWTVLPDMDNFGNTRRKAYFKFVGEDNDWDIFEACEISMKAQRQIDSAGGTVRALTYGEIDYESVAKIIHIIKYSFCGLQKGELFYDLGSGTGKVSLAAALLHDFSRCCGVELLPELHTLAMALRERYVTACSASYQGRKSSSQSLSLLPCLEYIQGSFLSIEECNWTSGDVVFVNSHCLSDEMMQQLSELAGKMKIGSFIVTTTRTLNPATSGFRVVKRLTLGMSWGTAEVIFHTK